MLSGVQLGVPGRSSGASGPPLGVSGRSLGVHGGVSRRLMGFLREVPAGTENIRFSQVVWAGVQELW